MLQVWRQLAVSAKLSSNGTSRPAAPLFVIEKSDHLDMLLSEARPLAAAFAILKRLVVHSHEAALGGERRLILVEATQIIVRKRLTVAEKNLISLG